MAIITDDGIESTSLATYKSELEIAFTNAISADLDVDAQTPQGQMIGIFALNMSVLDDAIVQTFQALNPFAAGGDQLDSCFALLGVSRESATHSTVIATLTGVAGTVIPASTRAKTTAGDIFQATSDITLDEDGTANGEFESEDPGSIAIDANTLTKIVDVISGWETINNESAGTEGTDVESDFDYRTRYYDVLYQNALGTVDAIQSAVSTLDDVIECLVVENDQDYNVTKQNVTLLPHSIAVIVNGGETSDIGQTIYDKKPTGTNTEGANTDIQSVAIIETNDGKGDILIYFYQVEFVTVKIDIEIDVYETQNDLTSEIKSAILNYFAGTFSDSIDGIGIADSLYLSRLYIPINSVAGFDVTSLTMEIQGSGNPQTVIQPDLNQQLIATLDSISVTINV